MLCRNPRDPLELGNPNAYVAIARTMGLTPEKAADVVYRNVHRALEHGSMGACYSSGVERRKAGKEGIEIVQ